MNFNPSKVNPRTIKFADKAREAERQKQLAKMEEQAQKNKHSKAVTGKNPRKNTRAKNEEPEKPKKLRNTTKRDLEELEADYKLYRQEKKAKRKGIECVETVAASSDASCSEPQDLESCQTPKDQISTQDKQMPQSPFKKSRKRKHSETESQQTKTLRASLREKLQSMRHMRQTKRKA